METQQTQPHVVMVPSPGMGHLIPLVELAKQLHLHHKILVTLIIPTVGLPMKPQRQLLQALPTSISTIFLPPVNFDDLPEDVKNETRIALSIVRSLSALREKLKDFTDSTRIVALVVDLFGTPAFEVAKEFGVPHYMFFSPNAMVLSLVLHVPEFDEKFTCDYRDLTEPVQMPGCVPIHGRDLADALQDKKNEEYKWFLHMAKQYYSAAGIMVNSFMDLEPGAFTALMETKPGLRPSVYPVGPLIKNSSINEADHSECLTWLEQQPSLSVLFVSFGSGGTLSHEQLNELALGLEMSGQRFLWVVRRPHERVADAAYLSVQSIKDPFDFLPEGFLERTKEVGLVVPYWAPQIQVLSHSSTGGFLTHCGWNSLLESIVHGVPLIAWPLYAEQRMNAVLVTDDLKVALRVKTNENGLVVKEDIAMYATELMEGEEGNVLRKNMKELKDAAANALSQDGSSTKSLAKVAQMWKT